jgi:hypothetical protein
MSQKKSAGQLDSIQILLILKDLISFLNKSFLLIVYYRISGSILSSFLLVGSFETENRKTS